jgi:hypothetical protein
LRSHADETRPQYLEMVGALRRLRDGNSPVRFVTSFAMVGYQCITVLDTGDTENEISHCGDPWLPEDELVRVLAGESLLANVLNADDFGVWVSGIAPVYDAQGAVVAAVTVDAPVVESLGRLVRGDRSHTLAAMLQSAAIRFSRAEVEAITDGLTGLYNHRYLHERLDKADWRCTWPRAPDATACWPSATSAWPARPGSRDGGGRVPRRARRDRFHPDHRRLSAVQFSR